MRSPWCRVGIPRRDFPFPGQAIRAGEPISNFTPTLHASVKSLAGEFTYGYDAKSPALLTKMTGPVHEVETSYEPHRNLITGVVNKAKPGGARSPLPASPDAAPAADSIPAPGSELLTPISSYTYANDLLGRRETISQGGDAFGMLTLGQNKVEVAYNDRSEVTGAVYRTGGEARQTFEYDYDAIGNRREAASSRVTGQESREEKVSYETNALNQYVAIDERGSSNPKSEIENPQFDPDGNLLEDVRNTYTWNADNNLIRVDAKDGSLRLDYIYDHQSRRTVRTETTNPGKDNESRRTTYYLYDDWNVVAEASAVTGHGAGVTGKEADSVRYYTLGRDLSGSLQSAGGVGGLLAISTVHPTEATENWNLKTENFKTLYPTYDANGNIGQLINGTGSIVAAYAYDPFGNVTEMAGAEAAGNPWRFSTKPVEAGTGWLYYGYRWYDVEMGRWVNRDPIEESGGVNLYGFVGNDGVGDVDVLGKNPRDRYGPINGGLPWNGGKLPDWNPVINECPASAPGSIGGAFVAAFEHLAALATERNFQSKYEKGMADCKAQKTEDECLSGCCRITVSGFYNPCGEPLYMQGSGFFKEESCPKMKNSDNINAQEHGGIGPHWGGENAPQLRNVFYVMI